LAAGTKTVDLTGKIVMPGFVSGHSHLWQSVFRGIAPDGELHPWLRALHWRYGSFLEDGDFGAFTRHGAYDQLRHGITTTYNHSHWMGKSYPRYLEQWQAELTLPQRFVFRLGQ
jgi:5-methylthioadenosine/S-adenosylhomocysteine deaminase